VYFGYGQRRDDIGVRYTGGTGGLRDMGGPKPLTILLNFEWGGEKYAGFQWIKYLEYLGIEGIILKKT
jgi:hypothetical protein